MNTNLTCRLDEQQDSSIEKDEEVAQLVCGIGGRRRPWEGYLDITRSVNQHCEKHFKSHVMLMLNSRFYFKIYYYKVKGVDFSMQVDGRR